MSRPSLPPVVPGRSALPAFLPIEAWARAQLEGAREAAQRRLEEAGAEAERLRADGEQRLREVVIEGEREALREVEDRASDRVADVRRVVHQWVEASEAASQTLVADALERLSAPLRPAASAAAGGD